MNKSIQINGRVNEIIYSNNENGYTVCEIESVKEGRFTATGYLPCVNEGDNVLLIGEWKIHHTYGEQFAVVNFEVVMPTDAEEIYRYLATGIVKGVREATAKKIVEYFGDDSFNIMLNEPMKLAYIKGISPKKAAEIGESFAKLQAIQEIVIFLQKFQVSANFAIKVHKTLGYGAVEKIKKNPYILAERVDGIGFKTADNIAFFMGMPKNSIERIKAGVKYILTTAAYTSGHTYLPRNLLVEDAAYKLDISEVEVENAISALMLEHNLYVDNIEENEVCYLSTFLSAEEYIARRLNSLNFIEQKFGMGDKQVEEFIKRREKEEGITLADEQKEAIIAASKSSCVVITGGPGTGKTTAINTIIKLMKEMGLCVVLAAPTGRAAKRMSEVTGMEAKTIHRLLGVVGDAENKFNHDEQNPLKADVIILDEVSMIDTLLMNALLRAVKHGARLIFSGDADQLPSVGPGNILRDIINSDTIPTIRLEKIFRQAEQSLIVVNAHRINKSQMPELKARDRDFFFIKTDTQENTAALIIELYKKRLPAAYGLNPVQNIQVLSPSKKGAAGTIQLNKELQRVINPPDILKEEYHCGQNIFRVGDKVMQTKNNYELPWIRGAHEKGEGIFNGEMGIIAEISTKDKLMKIIFDDDKEVEYQFSYAEELEHAYSVTVHKSQGSEFPVVIIPTCNFAPALMYKNLLYTAITRAKGMVVLVGNEKSIERMVNSQNARPRYTGLEERLKRMKEIFNS